MLDAMQKFRFGNPNRVNKSNIFLENCGCQQDRKACPYVCNCLREKFS